MFVFIVSLFLSSTQASWLCTEASSVRDGQYITACGIGEDTKEAQARQKATKNAFKEFDQICDRSSDCKNYHVNIDPLRNECLKTKSEGYKCYRAIRAELTKSKKEDSDKSLKALMRSFLLLEKERRQRVTKWACDYKTEDIYKKIYRSKAQTDLDEAIEDAMTVPYEEYCIRFHDKVMTHLLKARKTSEAYDNYLLTTLRSISADPKNKGDYIVAYFYERGPLSDQQWEAAYGLLKSYSPSYMFRIAGNLFHPNPPSAANRKIQTKRLQLAYKEALASQFGFPEKISPEKAIQQFLRGLVSASRKKDQWLAYYAFKKFPKELDITNPKPFLYTLKNLFEEAKTSDDKLQIIEWMTAMLSRKTITKHPTDFMMSFVKKRKNEIDRLDPVIDDEATRIDELKLQMSTFTSSNMKNFDRAFAASKNKNAKRIHIDFCLDYEIPCPSIVPNDKQLKKRLTSKKPKTILATLKILEKKKDSAAKLHKEIFSCLKRFNKGRHSSSITRAAIKTLIESEIKELKMIDVILQIAWEGTYSYEEVAEKLRGDLLPSALHVAMKPNHRNQLVAIRTLGLIGKEGKPAIKKLQRLANNKKSHYSVRNAAQKSIEQIEAAAK